jgi:hypothetical protein
MALSRRELELQTAEYLPARQVMTTFGHTGGPEQSISKSDGHVADAQYCNVYRGGILNGLNVQDVATDINVEEVQVVLINILVEDVQDAVDLGSANDDAAAIVED